MGTDGDFRLGGLVCDALGVGDPAFHFIGAGEGFGGEVVFRKQAPVVFAAGIDPCGIDVRQCRGWVP